MKCSSLSSSNGLCFSSKDSCDALTELLCGKLSSMTKELDKFITCVHQLQVHFPPIVDRYGRTVHSFERLTFFGLPPLCHSAG